VHERAIEGRVYVQRLSFLPLDVGEALCKPFHVQAVANGEADAVLAATIFHFGMFITGQAKKYLAQHGVLVRRIG